MFLRSAVEPVGERRLCHPGMARADVIGKGVKENFHFALVSGGDEFFVIVERAEMRIDGIEIHRAVTVVILCGAIFYDGREPESGNAEILEIFQMIANAPEVAAVPSARFRTIVR